MFSETITQINLHTKKHTLHSYNSEDVTENVHKHAQTLAMILQIIYLCWIQK